MCEVRGNAAWLMRHCISLKVKGDERQGRGTGLDAVTTHEDYRLDVIVHETEVVGF